MTGSPFTKSERKELREVAGELYEQELHALLEELDASFAQWRNGKIFSSDLSDAIHEFHQGPARELWSMYRSLSDDEIVARGVARGVIPLTRLGPALREKIEPTLGFWRPRKDAD